MGGISTQIKEWILALGKAQNLTEKITGEGLIRTI